MEVTFRKEGKTLIIDMIGELDHHASSIIRDKIDREISRTSTKNLIFDLKGLTFMDSSGIGVMLGRYKLIRKLDGKACLIHLNAQVSRIVNLSGMHKIIPTYNHLQEALEKM